MKNVLLTQTNQRFTPSKSGASLMSWPTPLDDRLASRAVWEAITKVIMIALI